MDTFPHDWLVFFKTHANRLQQSAFRMHNAQVTLALGRSVSTVTVSTCRRGWNRRMSGALDRVVAITTVQLQLACVKLMTERDRLFGLVTNVDDRWVDCSEQTSREVATNRDRSQCCEQREFVNPSWEMKLLHLIHHA